MHPRGDGGRGHGARPRRHDRHHRRPAGDRPGREDARRPRRRRDLRGADLPRRGPGLLLLRGGDAARSAIDDEGMRRRRARAPARRAWPRGAPAEVHLHGAQLPEPGRGDAVAPSGGGGWSRSPASASCWWSRTTRTGCCATRASRSSRSTSSTAATTSSTSARFSKILSPGNPPRLAVRAAAGDGEGRARQAGGRPVHLDPDPVLRPRVLRRGPLARVRRRSSRHLPRPPRRDARGARAAFPGRGHLVAARGRPLPAGRRCPDYIDTTDLLAKALRENVAFVPGAAAYVDGRGGSAMRLNFSASGEDEIREGIKRIGRVIDEQIELYDTITCEHQIPNVPPASSASRPGGGRVSRWTGIRAAVSPAGPAMKVAVLKGGRGLERQVSLRSGARVEDALARARTRGRADRRRRRARPDPEARAPRRRLHRPARPRRRGRHRPGAARDPADPVHRARVCAPACARSTRSRAKHELRAAGVPTPDWVAFSAHRLPRAGRRRGAGGDRGGARVPARGQAGARRLVARASASPPRPPRSRRRSSPPSPTTTGCCSSATSQGRELAVSLLDGDRAARGRGDRPRRGPLQLRGALRDRPHRIRLPGRARRRRGPGARRRAAHLGRARLRRLLPAST